VARKVFLAMLEAAGFVEARCAGTGSYRTSAYTQATFYTARKPGGPAPPRRQERRE
jgi:hypothetical protein